MFRGATAPASGQALGLFAASLAVGFVLAAVGDRYNLPGALGVLAGVASVAVIVFVFLRVRRRNSS